MTLQLCPLSLPCGRCPGAAPLPRRQRERGISLVIVLILLGAMSLASLASLRASAGSMQLLRARAMQQLALEQAQFALQHCQAQLLLPSPARDPRLADSALPLSTAQAMVWTVAANWQTGGPSVSVPPPPLAPSSPPASCLVERQLLEGLGADSSVYVITARGLSPDHSPDALTGATRTGVALWLQATVLVEGTKLRARSHTRIINPPLR